MGCATAKPKPLYNTDQFSALERALGFSSMNISDFAAKTEKSEMFTTLSYEELCERYKREALGISLKRQDSGIRRLFQNHQMSKELELKHITIVCLALLYSKGTLDQKKNVIFQFYKREDEKVYRKDIYELIKEILTLAGIIVPALQKPEHFKGLKQDLSSLINSLTQDLTNQIFLHSSEGLDHDEFYFDINRRTAYFLDAVAIRENLRIMQLARKAHSQ